MADTTILAIEHVVKTPGILGGEPRIAGRRIPVSQIVYLYRDQATSIVEFEQHFDLTAAQVYTALAYYYDHREEIDRLIEADLAAEQGHEKGRFQAKAELQWGQDLTTYGREMTVTEVAEEFDLSPRVVREACQKGWVEARKSGATWLISRAAALARWGIEKG